MATVSNSNATNQYLYDAHNAYIEFIWETSVGALLLLINIVTTLLLIGIVRRKELRGSKYYTFIFVTSLNNFLVLLVYMVGFLKTFKPTLFHSKFWCRISAILIHFYTYSLGFIFEAFAVVYCIAVVYPNLYLQLDSFYKSCYVLIYSLSVLFTLPLIPTFNIVTAPDGFKMCAFINNYSERTMYSIVLASVAILPTMVHIITFYKVVKHIYFSDEIQTQVEQFITHNKNNHINHNDQHHSINGVNIDQQQSQPNSNRTFVFKDQENLAIKMSTFVYVRNFFLLNIVTLCVCWIPFSVIQILMINGYLGKTVFYRISHLLTLNYPAFHSIFILTQNKKINRQLKKAFGIKTKLTTLL